MFRIKKYYIFIIIIINNYFTYSNKIKIDINIYIDLYQQFSQPFIKMIIPVKCVTCGKVIADKYRYYLNKVREKKLEEQPGGDDVAVDKVLYLTKHNIKKTPEGQVLDDIGFTKMCCRRHFLTHVDIQ